MLRRRRRSWTQTVFSKILLDPCLPNHCLYASLGYFLRLGENEKTVHALRRRAVRCWLEASMPCLGMRLADVAKAVNRRPADYLRATLHRRWGGYREAVLLSQSCRLSLRIWDSDAKLILCSPVWGSRYTADLHYNGSHYRAVEPKTRALLRAIPQIVKANKQVGIEGLWRSGSWVCGRGRGLEKNVKQKRGPSAHIKQRRAGPFKMSPIWWASAVVWHSYTFSSEEIQLAQKAVAVLLPVQKQVNVIAELRESRCDQQSFIRFCKADDLGYLGIASTLFQPFPVRCYGEAPERVAKMKGSVTRDKVEQVMKRVAGDTAP